MKKYKFFTNQILLAQAAAILIWLMISILQWSNNPKSSPGILMPVIVRGVESFSILLVSSMMIMAVDRISVLIKQYMVLLLLVPFIYVGSVLASLISLLLRGFIGYAPPLIVPITFDLFFFIQSLHFYIPLTLVLVFVEIIRYKNIAQQEYEHKLIAEKALHQSQWLMLRYQLNPHFLFNTLNTIRALIGVDNENARKTVTEMSDYFRYSLSIIDQYHITLAEEMKAVINYLEIQKIRFQEKISTELDIKKGCEQCLIPVFSIQILAENAVKYGLKSSNAQLRITILCELDNGILNIWVRNNGRIINDIRDSDKHTQVGIENLKKRLTYIYPDSNFKLTEKEGIVTAHISIPNAKKNVVIN